MKRPIEIEDLFQFSSIKGIAFSADGKQIYFCQEQPNKQENKTIPSLWCVNQTGTGLSRFAQNGTHQLALHPSDLWAVYVSTSEKPPQLFLTPTHSESAQLVCTFPHGVISARWSPDGQRLAVLAPIAPADQGLADWFERQPTLPLLPEPLVINHLPYRFGTHFGSYPRQVFVLEFDSSRGEFSRPKAVTPVGIHVSQVHWLADGDLLVRAIESEHDILDWINFRLGRLAGQGVPNLQWLTPADESVFDVVVTQDGTKWAYQYLPSTDVIGRVCKCRMVLPDKTCEVNLTRNIVSWSWSPDSRRLYLCTHDQGGTPLNFLDETGEMVFCDGLHGYQVERLTVNAQSQIALVARTVACGGADAYLWENGQIHALTDLHSAFAAQVQVAETQELNFSTPDGNVVQGWLILPPEWQSKTDLPLVTFIHGGPHAMWAPANQAVWHDWQVHTAKGYVVFVCNPRGSDGYGEAWMQAIRANWGKPAMTDVLAGIDWVCANLPIDRTRLYLSGGSYGGYLTTWILAHDARFCAAVTQRGVYNLVSFYGTTDIPQFVEQSFDVQGLAHADFLWACSPLAYVEQIHTPLLIKHAENDFRVPIEQAEQLFCHLHRLGREVLFHRYPRDGHELSRSGEPKNQIHRLQSLLGWWENHAGHE
ncbi:MAG TPA: S9 family peptidase [Anaerolineales bacterium]|nr:S9 family peptidase [Anaerolineales bacterium]